jgi:maltose alpha-D-glucosyltransferase/alpha-amylase
MASRTPPSERLAAWLVRQRWWAAKDARLRGLELADGVVLGQTCLGLVRVELADGTRDLYAVPWQVEAGPGAVVDGLDAPTYSQALAGLILTGASAAGQHGVLVGRPTAAAPAPVPGLSPVRRLGVEQSHSSVAVGPGLLLKHFRRLAGGRHPEEEMTRVLTERARCPCTPRLYGHLEYRRAGWDPITVAVLHERIPDAVDGSQWMRDALGEAWACLQRERRPPDRAAVLRHAAPTLTALDRLGTALAALHSALAAEAEDPAFRPEPVTDEDLATWAAEIRQQLEAAREVLGPGLPVTGPAVDAALRALWGTVKSRQHGDFHLGQTLYRPATGEFFIVDFEGEPLRPLAHRRRKLSPLRDVAGLLRSLDYARASAAPSDPSWGAVWLAEGAPRFCRVWRRHLGAARVVPQREDALARALAVFEVEKAAYEVCYEARHRPAWVPLARQGLLRALAHLAAAEPAAEA